MPPEERREQVWRALLAWYAAEGRAHLPWRETRDPYAILVSEVMLQQTQVERVLPKYREFLARFPTLAALAAAPAREVDPGVGGLGLQPCARCGCTSIARQAVERVRRAITQHTGRADARSRASGATRRARWPASPSGCPSRPWIRTYAACSGASFAASSQPPGPAARRRRACMLDAGGVGAAARAGLRLAAGADGPRRDGSAWRASPLRALPIAQTTVRRSQKRRRWRSSPLARRWRGYATSARRTRTIHQRGAWPNPAFPMEPRSARSGRLRLSPSSRPRATSADASWMRYASCLQAPRSRSLRSVRALSRTIPTPTCPGCASWRRDSHVTGWRVWTARMKPSRCHERHERHERMVD